ncbi:CPBP family glutamic-type intramembrane protease [Massilia sp. CCM 8734]|uniref:CPBP family glutamic-type intramembrane protease n=1 Tax=Massilia sp. CCM 8734 TaxID=2609283 RepID=UPI0034D2F383
MLLIWTFVTIFDESSFGSIAGAKIFKSESIIFIGVMTLCWAPLFETLLGQVIPVELVRTISSSKIQCIIASALLFSLGHFLGGAGWGQLLLTFLAGLPLAALYVKFRRQGIAKSFYASAIAHATHNAAVLLLSYVIAR